MLQDYKPQMDTPKRQGRLALVYLQATFATGVASVDTDKSSPRVTLVKSTTGLYNVTFPKCTYVHVVGAHLDPGADDPSDPALKIVSPRAFTPASGGTGIGKVLFSNTDDGGPEDPGDTTRFYLTLLVGN
jgi:hypothetical protein